MVRHGFINYAGFEPTPFGQFRDMHKCPIQANHSAGQGIAAACGVIILIPIAAKNKDGMLAMVPVGRLYRLKDAWAGGIHILVNDIDTLLDKCLRLGFG